MRLDTGAVTAAFLRVFARDGVAAFLVFQHPNSFAAPGCKARAMLFYAMTPDLKKYTARLKGSDLSEAQKEEVCLALWRIMEGFADRAFGLHPVDHAGLEGSGFLAGAKSDLVNSSPSSKTDFDTASARPACASHAEQKKD